MTTAGLSSEEAARLLQVDGPNELQREAVEPAWRQLLAQFRSPMILILLGAAALSGMLGELPEAIAIVSIVILNAVVGFVQERRAERAVLALRAMTAPRARVLRDGQAVVLPAREIVRGDVLLLESGDLVAADAHLVEAHALSSVESTLTGESVPVEKSVAPAAPEAPLAERTDHVFLGTSIASGSGRALVVATGTATELGKIAHLLTTATEQPTPLQDQLARVGRSLVLLCLAVVALVAGIGLLRGTPWLQLLVSSISLAVAAVPEGLPAVITIALALGTQRMTSRNVLVRRLPAVEALGSTTVICTDKTGTLTKGVMSVREVWCAQGVPEAELLTLAASCCDAELTDRGGVGDPTEVAILERAREAGIERRAIEQTTPRVQVWPFDSTRKRMSVLRSDGVVAVKGALELLLPRCDVGTEGAVAQTETWTGRGLRVLAVARRGSASADLEAEQVEQHLTLMGLLGLADPPRPEAIEAIAAARQAGVRVVMMTGDHPTTAAAIAREMGLLQDGQDPTGIVSARVTPEEKLRIVRELKARGEVVAVTGDGTNDAPALKEAHVGIAMGVTGVEVTREAADLVLSDDNFASIVAAIREGRGIYENIRRALVYLLGGNFGELLVTLSAALLGLAAPLLPLHLLWINLVTDGLPALVLVMEPASDDVLRRPPRPAKAAMLGRPEWFRIVSVGLLVGGVSMACFVWKLRTGSVEQARTLAFSTLVFAQVFNAFAFRSFERPAWELAPRTNPRLLAVVGLTALIQLGVLLFPFSRALFDLGPLDLETVVASVLVGLVPVAVLELGKFILRARSRRQP